MNPKRLLSSLLLAVVVLGGACTKTPKPGVPNDISTTSADAVKDIKPPPAARADLTGRVGLILATNSRTWGKLLNTPTGKGVVVLFIQPSGPSDKVGLDRGDLITDVDGKPAYNQEYAANRLLRARNGEKRELGVTKVGGKKTKVTVTAKTPGRVDQYGTYNVLIGRNPNDPILYYLRGQLDGLPADNALADADKAVQLAPGFVEAINLRAQSLLAKSRLKNVTATQADDLRNKSLQDIGLALRLDPNNTLVLSTRANTLLALGQSATAKREAQKAISIDPNVGAAQNALAIANITLSKYADAAGPARKAVEANPYQVRYYQTLARVFMRLNRKADAEATVKAIINLVPAESTGTREIFFRILEGR